MKAGQISIDVTRFWSQDVICPKVSMTLEGLLTFIGILVGIMAIVTPVQRRSLNLFVPGRYLAASLLLALVLLIIRDAPFGVPPPFGWPLEPVLFYLTVGAFLLPVLATVWSWMAWHRARLTPKRLLLVEEVFQAALRNDQFDELERIVRKNKDRLEHLPANAATILFSRKIVTALADAGSMLHLELLSDIEFFHALDNPFGALDAVARELLHTSTSPLRSAIVSRYGGLENLKYTDAERALMEKTFFNPAWYRETRADYPLVISAIETLTSGRLDHQYNDVGRAYEASQGVSTRATCPIYLAMKTIVLALEEAIEQKAEGDFYVSDLFDIFRAVLERSTLNVQIWESDLANWEYPTPYAYLLYTITHDLWDLSCTAVKKATSNDSVVRAPGDIAHDLAQMWSFCVWSIADSEGQVSSDFRRNLIRDYLEFILELGWEPSQVYHGPVGKTGDLNAWRDLFAEQLRERFVGDAHPRRDALKEAMNSLDSGKMYFQGHKWLEKKLFGSDATDLNL